MAVQEMPTVTEADIQTVALSGNSYDLIVTHFLLDCFSEETLPPLVGRLADAATAEAHWLIADFCHPPRGWRRFRARVFIATSAWNNRRRRNSSRWRRN